MDTTRPASESAGFDEILESRLRQLLTSIGNATLDELESEVSSLGRLIDAYKRNDELLEDLLNPSTPTRKREELLERLQAQHLIVAKNQAQLERLHARAQQVLARSVNLLVMIDRQVYKRVHRTSKYAPEICRYCKGTGGRTSERCPACHGERTVLVYQPPLLCPRCKGDGKADPAQLFRSNVCIVCRGKGWALTVDR